MFLSFRNTELFTTPAVGNSLVEIVGVPPPSSPLVKWRLTVSENTQGVPDRFPRFLPETNVSITYLFCFQ